MCAEFNILFYYYCHCRRLCYQLISSHPKCAVCFVKNSLTSLLSSISQPAVVIFENGNFLLLLMPLLFSFCSPSFSKSKTFSFNIRSGYTMMRTGGKLFPLNSFFMNCFNEFNSETLVLKWNGRESENSTPSAASRVGFSLDKYA